MAHTCITVIKVLGASSLGLLTSSLAYQSIQSIPLLINQLNARANFNFAEISAGVRSKITWTRVINVVAGVLSAGLLSVAFKYSSPKDKHPYIIYSALSAPLALLGTYYQSYGYETKLLRKKGVPRPHSATTDPVVVSEESDQESLGKSYIHVSDEDSLTVSTPASSTPNSPQTAAQDLEHELLIEEEVENALYKKEYVNDLDGLRSGYLIGSLVLGVGLFMAVVGIIGDTYFL